jgi:hypothetical protein
MGTRGGVAEFGTGVLVRPALDGGSAAVVRVVDQIGLSRRVP